MNIKNQQLNKEVVNFEIERAKLRKGMLCDINGNKCAIGWYLSALGMSDDILRSYISAADLLFSDIPSWMIKKEIFGKNLEEIIFSDIYYEIIRVNDKLSEAKTQTEIESKIVELFKNVGITVKYK